MSNANNKMQLNQIWQTAAWTSCMTMTKTMQGKSKYDQDQIK